jgi:hypothetical protein
MRCIFGYVAIIAILLFSSCKPRKSEKVIGVKIYKYEGNFEVLAGRWSEIGINTAFVSRSLASDMHFREAVAKRGIAVFVIFPVFQNPELLKQDSSLFAITGKGFKAKDDWVQFICPSRESYRRLKLAELDTIVSSLAPDGISFDFIRQFVYWEKIYPGTDPLSIDRACYCDSCIASFNLYKRISIPPVLKKSVEKARWIDKNYPVEWDRFRCDQVTEMVKLLSDRARLLKPGIKISIHAVPWRDEDFNKAGMRIAGQDIKRLSEYADYISPMCYSQMIDRNESWIYDVIRKMDRKAPGKILPSIQVYPYFADRPYSSSDFSRSMRIALRPPSRGVVFFSWSLFARDSSRIDSVKHVLGRIPHN